MSLKLIFVAGVASGGTSAVAGVLHHLGVDMGEIDRRPSQRSYKTFECAHSFEQVTNGLWEEEGGILIPQFSGNEIRRRMMVYIQQRFDAAKRRPGVKNVGLQWIAAADSLAGIPLEVIAVLRKPDAVVDSLQRHEGKPRAMTDTMYGCHRMMLNFFIQRAKPQIVVQYESLVSEPHTVVDQIVTAFRLPTTTRRVQRAINFVKRP